MPIRIVLTVKDAELVIPDEMERLRKYNLSNGLNLLNKVLDAKKPDMSLSLFLSSEIQNLLWPVVKDFVDELLLGWGENRDAFDVSSPYSNNESSIGSIMSHPPRTLENADSIHFPPELYTSAQFNSDTITSFEDVSFNLDDFNDTF
jgi:hypothetical protein